MVQILDIAAVSVILMSVAAGYKAGFIKTVLYLARVAIAIFLAVMFMNSLSVWLNTNYIGPFMEKQVLKGIGSILNENELIADLSVESAVDKLEIKKLVDEAPPSLTKLLDKYNINLSALQNKIKENISNAELIKTVSTPIAKSISDILAFVIIFIVSIILLTIAIHLINTIAGLPVLKQFNQLLGIGIGFLKGILIVFILTAILKSLVPYLQNNDLFIVSEEIINKTFLLKHFYNFNIFTLTDINL